MTRILAASLVTLLAIAAPVFAEDVKPGTAPTEAVTGAVPTMKGDCATNTAVDTKARGTEATEATGKAVPNMKPGDVDCPETAPKKPDGATSK